MRKSRDQEVISFLFHLHLINIWKTPWWRTTRSQTSLSRYAFIQCNVPL